MSVKILKRNKKLRIRATHNIFFALRITLGDYLFNNPNDEELREVYECLPALKSMTSPRGYLKGGMTQAHFGVHLLQALDRGLNMVKGGGWPQLRAVNRRIRDLQNISPLELLGAAGAE